MPNPIKNRLFENLLIENFVSDLGIETIVVEDLPKFFRNLDLDDDDGLMVTQGKDYILLEGDGGRIKVKEKNVRKKN